MGWASRRMGSRGQASAKLTLSPLEFPNEIEELTLWSGLGKMGLRLFMVWDN